MADRPIPVVVAEDEPVARRGIGRLINADPRLELVASCRNGVAALVAIRECKPCIAVLDIAMPGLSGLEVARALSGDERPEIIFATAYDQFAVDAFELSAIDYLLKPYDDGRFGRAMDRALERTLTRRAPHWNVDAMADAFARRARGEELLTVRDGDAVVFLPVNEIDWAEAADNYVRLHLGTRRHLIRETMRAIEQRLAPHGFARIHRSAIVNRSRIRALKPTSNGEYTVVLTTGVKLTLSRGYRDSVLPQREL